MTGGIGGCCWKGDNCQGPMIAPNGWLVHFSALFVVVVVSTTTTLGRRTREMVVVLGWRAVLHYIRRTQSQTTSQPPNPHLTTTSTHTEADNGGKFGTTRITNLHILALCTNVATLICTAMSMPHPSLPPTHPPTLRILTSQ